MSHESFIGEVRLRRRAGVSRLLAAFLAIGLLQVAPADAILPVTADCRSDADGANDTPGETDLTRLCVQAGNGAPYELETISSLDLARHEGAATIHVCSLYNTDGDAFANLAACASVKHAAGGGGNELVLKEVRLYTCTDTKADRCTGSALVTGPYSTSCMASQEKADPFPGPAPGPGSNYPEDTLVYCEIDVGDFSSAGLGAKPLDACSYSSANPDSDPSDCLVFRACEVAADCEDESSCTTDTCDASGVCKYSPNAGAACSDQLFCNGDEKCTSLGLCGAAQEARDCDDAVACTLDTCDEIIDSCVNHPRNSVCSDDLFCTGVEVCDGVAGCRPGIPPNCGDGVTCTADACNEASDGCDHTAQDDACSAVLAQLAGQPQ